MLFLFDPGFGVKPKTWMDRLEEGGVEGWGMMDRQGGCARVELNTVMA